MPKPSRQRQSLIVVVIGFMQIAAIHTHGPQITPDAPFSLMITNPAQQIEGASLKDLSLKRLTS